MVLTHPCVAWLDKIGLIMKKNFYAVRTGKRNKVIVKTWDECSALVTGIPGARFKGFQTSGEAEAFNNSADKPKSVKKEPVKKSIYTTPNWPCLERKSYLCPVKGIYFKNRCVLREGPTKVGANYKPHIGNSVPW
jgi:hypothetical protein